MSNRAKEPDEQILDLAHSEDEVTLTDLKQDLDIDAGTAFTTAESLVEDGALVRVNHFTFRWPEAESTVAEDEAAIEPSLADAEADSQLSEEPTDSPSDASGDGDGATHSEGEQTAEDSTPEPESVGPPQTKKRVWGSLLMWTGIIIGGLGAVAFYSVWSGGLFGILTEEIATGIAVFLAGLGGLGIIQGVRAYRSR